jgi:hypothetical protein
MTSPVMGSMRVIRSTWSPHSSTRTTVSSYAGWISMVSPRERNRPRARFWFVRWYWMLARRSRAKSRSSGTLLMTRRTWPMYSSGVPNP